MSRTWSLMFLLPPGGPRVRLLRVAGACRPWPAASVLSGRRRGRSRLHARWSRQGVFRLAPLMLKWRCVTSSVAILPASSSLAMEAMLVITSSASLHLAVNVMFRDAFGPHVSPSRGTLASLPDGLCATIEVWGYRSQPMLACRFVNRVVTASDSVDTSRMERPVLCACVGPQRTLLAPAGGWRCRSLCKSVPARGLRPVSGSFLSFNFCDECFRVVHTLACVFVFVLHWHSVSRKCKTPSQHAMAIFFV